MKIGDSVHTAGEFAWHLPTRDWMLSVCPGASQIKIKYQLFVEQFKTNIPQKILKFFFYELHKTIFTICVNFYEQVTKDR